MRKRIAIFTLALALCLGLAACGGESGSSTADGSSQSSESSESTGSTEGESSSEAEGGDAAATGEFKLPIVDEPVELSYFVSASTNAAIVTTTDARGNRVIVAIFVEASNKTNILP